MMGKFKIIRYLVIVSLLISLISVALFFGFISGAINIYPLAGLRGFLLVAGILLSFPPCKLIESISKRKTTNNSNRNPLKYFPFNYIIKICRELTSLCKINPIKRIHDYINDGICHPKKTDNFSNYPAFHAVDSNTGETNESTKCK